MYSFKSFIRKIFNPGKRKELIEDCKVIKEGDLIEPYTEIRYKDDSILLLLDISGAFKETIRVYIEGDNLVVRAHSIMGVYEKRLIVDPTIALAGNPLIHYKNGVLTVEFSKPKGKLCERFISVNFHYPLHMKSA